MKLFVTTLTFAGLLSAGQSVAVIGSVQQTHNTTGIASGIESEIQGSKPSFGVAVEYRKSIGRTWGVEGDFGVTASDARFKAVGGSATLQFGLTRYEVSGFVTKQFHSSETRLRPFVAVGAGEWITNGKWAPGGVVGLDYTFQEAFKAGADVRLTNRLSLRGEVVSHLFKAPNFSDPLYKAGRTFIVEPRIGVSWSF